MDPSQYLGSFYYVGSLSFLYWARSLVGMKWSVFVFNVFLILGYSEDMWQVHKVDKYIQKIFVSLYH